MTGSGAITRVMTFMRRILNAVSRGNLPADDFQRIAFGFPFFHLIKNLCSIYLLSSLVFLTM